MRHLLERLGDWLLETLFNLDSRTLPIELFRMHKSRQDYLSSEFYKSLNHDKSVTCAICGRYPELWEDAFPHKICEECNEIWLDEQWEKKYRKDAQP